MRKELDLDNWNRKEHFHFFTAFDEPFFGLVANVDCTRAYRKAKEQNWSFFSYYLYQSLKAANLTEEFKYRIEEGKVYRYDTIHASPTISREDSTFGFSFIEYQASPQAFVQEVARATEAVRQSTGLRLNAETGRPDVIHYSAIPWVTFTGLTHARSFAYKDSVPKISFGKYFREGDKLLLPVSINVHHGLMDAYHVGKYLETFGQLLNE